MCGKATHHNVPYIAVIKDFPKLIQFLLRNVPKSYLWVTGADGFTFTTPINDLIGVQEFKDGCWPTNRFFKTVNFIKMTESGGDVILLVEMNTTDNKIARNVGRGISFPGNTK